MEPDAIEAAMSRLQPGPHGWRCELPARFLDQPVGLRVDTRSVPAGDPPPPPSPAESELVRVILAGLTEVLASCEQRYRERYTAYPQLISGARDPHIWVARNLPGRETPEDWAFVVGVAGDPDWGAHADFRGLELLGMWSGD